MIHIVDENICEYYSDTKEDEEGAYPIVGWCNDNYCKCDDIPFDECLVKAIQYCKLKDKQLARKTQECEQIKEKYEALKLENQEGYEIVAELKHECEELKDKLKIYEKMFDNSEFRVALTDMRTGERDIREQRDKRLTKENGRYREALEEIEEYTKKYFCENCEDFNTPEYSSHCEFCEYQEYFDIINEAKGENKNE